VGILGIELGAKFLGYVTARVGGRLEGLTDDEYLWEPVPDCWTVRPGEDGVWHADLGPQGSTFTLVTPAPFTTIAWRMWHLSASPNPTWPPTDPRTATELIDGWFLNPRPQSAADAVGDAATATRLLLDVWTRFAASVTALSDDDLLTVMGPVAGPFAESTVLGLVIHIGDELVHHAAEIGTLRDLYAHQR
jgi:hypothetical protein